MASSTSNPFPLATQDPYSGGSDSTPGDANSGPGSAAAGDAAGASGSSAGSIEISHGAIIAIIVVVVVIALVGVATAVLFYVAKKREWTIKETIRKSARKVVEVLTPRRSEFPKSVKDSMGDSGSSRSRGMRMKLDDVPPTPRLKPEDLEKGLAVQVSEKKRGNFSRKARPGRD